MAMPSQPTVYIRLSGGNEIQFGSTGIIITAGGKQRKNLSLHVDDIIGAKSDPLKPNVITLAELIQPRGARSPADVADSVHRKLVTHRIEVASTHDAARVVDLARLLALGSATRARRVVVIINPHSGNKSALPLYEKRVKPLLAYAGIDADVTLTAHAGHAIELGKSYDPSKYEGAIFVSGDGTVQEMLSGLLSRRDWRTVVRRTPILSIACGTQNALARGLRTRLPEHATWCVIKHKLRPLDGMLVSNGAGLRTIALCGIGFGLASDIARDSEAYRFLGITRYAYLKVKHALSLLLGLHHHEATVVMDADIGMDNTALSIYFAKPVADVRVPRPGGGFTIAHNQHVLDPDMDAGANTVGRLLAEGASAPPDVRLMRTASQVPLAGGGPDVHFTSTSGAQSSQPDGIPPRDRVAHVQISFAALQQYGGPAAIERAAQISEMAAHVPLKYGYGRVLGADSLSAMPDLTEEDRRSMPPMPHAHGKGDRGSMFVEVRGTGGGIVTGSEPSAVIVERMQNEKMRMQAMEDAEETVAAASRGRAQAPPSIPPAPTTAAAEHVAVSLHPVDSSAMCIDNEALEDNINIFQAQSTNFGELIRCTANCRVCAQKGRLRYIGHRREAIIITGTRPAAGSEGEISVKGDRGGTAITSEDEDRKLDAVFPSGQPRRYEDGVIVSGKPSSYDDKELERQEDSAHGSLPRIKSASSSPSVIGSHGEPVIVGYAAAARGSPQQSQQSQQQPLPSGTDAGTGGTGVLASSVAHLGLRKHTPDVTSLSPCTASPPAEAFPPTAAMTALTTATSDEGHDDDAAHAYHRPGPWATPDAVHSLRNSLSRSTSSGSKERARTSSSFRLPEVTTKSASKFRFPSPFSLKKSVSEDKKESSAAAQPTSALGAGGIQLHSRRNDSGGVPAAAAALPTTPLLEKPASAAESPETTAIAAGSPPSPPVSASHGVAAASSPAPAVQVPASAAAVAAAAPAVDTSPACKSKLYSFLCRNYHAAYAAAAKPFVAAPPSAIPDVAIMPHLNDDVGGQILLTRGSMGVTGRGYERRQEHASYITIAAMNLVPEGRYCHPSDSYVDLVFARKGNIWQTIGLMLRFLSGRERGSPLYEYVKVRSIVLSPDPGQEDASLNVDGEVLPGPGPFRINLLPSFFVAYGTY